MPRADLTISPLRADERSAWEPLWQSYMEFYKTSVPAEATECAWERLHDPKELMFGLGAYIDGRLCGFVHYLFHRSFWTIGDYCYLQDLFVTEAARGTGCGRALIEAVADKALEAGADRVYWLTQEDNHTARALYDKVAARSGFIQYRRML